MLTSSSKMSSTNNKPSTNRRRLLCLWLPRLPTDRFRRQRLSAQAAAGADTPRNDRDPIVVAAKINNELKVVAVDDAAARLNLAADMPLATARAMVPALTILDHDPDADLKTLNAIADWCDRFTPLVALDHCEGLVLDITGCAHLFGGEAMLMKTLCHTLTRQGFVVSAAISGTAVAARALTRFRHGVIVPSGEEADAVFMLPVSTLGVDQSIITGLRRAGLKTIGDVATRSRHEISARFGAAFTGVLQQALGEADAPISPRKPVPDYVTEKRFAEPVLTSDVLLRTLHELAEVLAATMERHGKGARRLEASFFRTDGVVRAIAVDAGQAVTDAAVALRLFNERLDALADPLDPGFGFDLVRLSASQTAQVASTQYGFDPAAHEADDVARLIDRLSARLGANRVIRYVPQDTHIPEYAVMTMPAQRKMADAAGWLAHHPHEPPNRPLRLFDNPERIKVGFALVPDGPPTSFLWRQLTHRVIRAEGPERIAMEWWRADGKTLTRDYFRVEDELGLRFWLFREGLFGRELVQPSWFLHGLFA
jgi:protein ImuB